MSEETRKVLEMLSNGKVTVQEAEQLLQAVAAPGADDGREEGRAAVFPHSRQQAGARRQEGRERQHQGADDRRARRAAARRVVPRHAGQERKSSSDNGTELDLSKVTYTDLEAMIKDIGELTVDVDGDAQVRIRCE